MQLFSEDATVFSKKFKFFCSQKVEKTTLQIAQKNSNPFFFLTAWAAKTDQTEKFVFKNVTYRPTVYRTGLVPGGFSDRSYTLHK